MLVALEPGTPHRSTRCHHVGAASRARPDHRCPPWRRARACPSPVCQVGLCAPLHGHATSCRMNRNRSVDAARRITQSRRRNSRSAWPPLSATVDARQRSARGPPRHSRDLHLAFLLLRSMESLLSAINRGGAPILTIMDESKIPRYATQQLLLLSSSRSSYILLGGAVVTFYYFTCDGDARSAPVHGDR